VGTNNGALANGVTFAAGKVGQAFSLAGNAYVNLPHSATLDPLTSCGQGRSIAAWGQAEIPPGPVTNIPVPPAYS
jgi:hypothetical protein